MEAFKRLVKYYLFGFYYFLVIVLMVALAPVIGFVALFHSIIFEKIDSKHRVSYIITSLLFLPFAIATHWIFLFGDYFTTVRNKFK